MELNTLGQEQEYCTGTLTMAETLEFIIWSAEL